MNYKFLYLAYKSFQTWLQPTFSTLLYIITFIHSIVQSNWSLSPHILPPCLCTWLEFAPSSALPGLIRCWAYTNQLKDHLLEKTYLDSIPSQVAHCLPPPSKDFMFYFHMCSPNHQQNVNSLRSGTDLSVFMSWFWHLLPLWPWASHSLPGPRFPHLYNKVENKDFKGEFQLQIYDQLEILRNLFLESYWGPELLNDLPITTQLLCLRKDTNLGLPASKASPLSNYAYGAFHLGDDQGRKEGSKYCSSTITHISIHWKGQEMFSTRFNHCFQHSCEKKVNYFKLGKLKAYTRTSCMT